jgi:hypothetical protein
MSAKIGKCADVRICRCADYFLMCGYADVQMLEYTNVQIYMGLVRYIHDGRSPKDLSTFKKLTNLMLPPVKNLHICISAHLHIKIIYTLKLWQAGLINSENYRFLKKRKKY